MDKRSLWQRKALNGSRFRLLIWGVLAAFLVVEKQRGSSQIQMMGILHMGRASRVRVSCL